MESFSYVQEGGKNFLKSKAIEKVDYIVGMFIHNDIPAFACARFKSLNSKNYICYDMNGLIPISQSFEMNKLNADRVESFLRSIIRLCKSMEEFMLPFDRLVVNENYIYESYNKNNEFFWIYGNEATDCTFTSLFETLLDRIDYKDDRAVKMMYSMYQTAKDSEDLLNKEMGGSSLLKIKEKAEEVLSSPYKSLDIRAKEIIRLENENNNILEIKKDKEEKEIACETIPNSDNMAKRYREKMGSIRDDNSFFSGNSERRKEKESIFKRKIPVERKNKEETKLDMRAKIKKVWNYLNSDIGSKSKISETEEFMTEEEVAYNVREVRLPNRPKTEVNNEATTLLTGAMVGKGIYCLKSDDINEESILLTEFPFFIGKSGEKTNHRIEDSTVSRFHARIDKEEDELWLTDLNSTNGTFLNGIRMVPYGRMHVSRGDSIVISRKRYELKFLV